MNTGIILQAILLVLHHCDGFIVKGSRSSQITRRAEESHQQEYKCMPFRAVGSLVHQRRNALIAVGKVMLSGLALESFVSKAGAIGPVGDRGANDPFGKLPSSGFASKSGMKYFDYDVGSGPPPKYGQIIIVKYIASAKATGKEKLQIFDSSFERGGGDYIMKHGNGRCVLGLDEGIHTMRVGGKRRILVPPNLGYTVPGLGPFPPEAADRRILNKILAKMDDSGYVAFDVMLIDAYDDDADAGYYDDTDLPPGVLDQVYGNIERFKQAVNVVGKS